MGEYMAITSESQIYNLGKSTQMATCLNNASKEIYEAMNLLREAYNEDENIVYENQDQVRNKIYEIIAVLKEQKDFIDNMRTNINDVAASLKEADKKELAAYKKKLEEEEAKKAEENKNEN